MKEKTFIKCSFAFNLRNSFETEALKINIELDEHTECSTLCVLKILTQEEGPFGPFMKVMNSQER